MEIPVPFSRRAGHAVAAAVLLIAALAMWSGWIAPRAASAAGVWGQAEVITFGVPVNASPFSQPYTVSCPTAGNCAAVGQYDSPAGPSVAFVMTSVNGVWGQATGVTFPGGVQNASPNSILFSVSCPSAGNCVAVGRFKNVTGGYEGFTVTSSGGTWGTAQVVAFAGGVQNATANTTVRDVSCASVGNCVAVGDFRNAGGDFEAFTVKSSGGTWGNAAPVTFAGGVQNATPDGYLWSVSCGAVGECVAGGYFKLANTNSAAFTVTLSGGTWADGRPVAFAGGVQDATSPFDFVQSVSCPSAGNCVAGGYFVNAAGHNQPFTATLTNGTWANAAPVVFDASVVQSASPNAKIYAVSCSSVGNCAATGTFRNANGDDEVFVMASTNGTWADATAIAFDAGIQNTTPDARPYTVSCGSAGNCVAGGYFRNASFGYEAFTVTLNGGTWETARPVEFANGVQGGLAAREARAAAVSCSSAGNCTVVGYVKNAAGEYGTFAASLVDNTPPTTTTTSTTVAPTTSVVATTTTVTTVASATTTVASTTTVPPVSAKSKTTSALLTFTSSIPASQTKAYEYSLDGGKTWKRVKVTKLDNGRLALTVNGLDAGTDYKATIRIVGTSGSITPAGVVSFTTSDRLPTTGQRVGEAWLTGVLLIALGGIVFVGRRRLARK